MANGPSMKDSPDAPVLVVDFIPDPADAPSKRATRRGGYNPKWSPASFDASDVDRMRDPDAMWGRRTGSVPDRTDLAPEVTVSDTGYSAMELQQKSGLLKDLQKFIRNEVLAQRSTDRMSSDSSPMNTDSISQGKEYGCQKDQEYRCPRNPNGSCPPIPDMTQYIRKDSIPCWGCNIEY